MYLGTNYKGFQIQENLTTDTVEGNLQLAFFKAGAIFYKNNEKIAKIGWKRVSRTDKGVHSAGSVISLKIQNPHSSLNQLVKEINKFLPLDIRIVDIIKYHKNKFTSLPPSVHQCCIVTLDKMLLKILLKMHLKMPLKMPLKMSLKIHLKDFQKNSIATTHAHHARTAIYSQQNPFRQLLTLNPMAKSHSPNWSKLTHF